MTAEVLSTTNVGQLLNQAAEQWPDHPAVAQPNGSSWRSVTFAELDRDSNKIAAGLRDAGVQVGSRMALLVPPGIDFVSLVFALFKTGAVIILVDPGIGRANLIRCLSEAEPVGVVGIPKAHLARWLFRRRFSNSKINVVVGRRSWPGCHSVQGFRERSTDEFENAATQLHDPAAIIFTSGSTGPPKGVLYQHGNFIEQTREIRDYFDIAPGGADISGFPLFALFNTAMGKTTVFPQMDFTRPARVAPEKFLRAVEDWRAEQSFGSPALWNTVSRWCERNKKRLPTIKNVMSAGAPVPDHVLARVKKLIAPDGEVYTPYGATEALPVACNSARIVLGETADKTRLGAGVCVGSRFPQIRWEVIAISDGPIKTKDLACALSTGEIGELIVSGPVVTSCYVTRTQANELHKIMDGQSFWHRMGDVGYFDEHQRFWFCGRKSQRVITADQTMFTVPCESIFNTHPAVYRSALVGIGESGQQIPVIIAETWPEHWPRTSERKNRLVVELRELVGKHEITREIAHIMLKRSLPVDIRHNAKIFREQLSQWATRRL